MNDTTANHSATPANDTATSDTQTEANAARPDLPDQLSVNPRSPHYNAEIFKHDVGIRLNGKARFDVEEYCISEGWVKVAAGKAVDRRGQPLLMKVKGTVEAFYR
jgi:hypothetical protein